MASKTVRVFNRVMKELQRDRAARHPHVQQYEQLRNEVAWQVCDRVHDIARKFPRVLDLGCGRGHIGKILQPDVAAELVQCDLSAGTLVTIDGDARDRALRVHCDEEHLPFADNTFDAVVSAMSMHWVNDLPGLLAEVHRVLKPDGVFVGAMLGGDTLFQLRSSLQLAEQERRGGFAPRMSPVVKQSDVGGLLQATRFTLLTVDIEDLTINYPSMAELLDDLQGMGESAASLKTAPLHRSTLLAGAAIYQSMYGTEEGHVPATFEVVHMVGWKPHPSQAKPLKRGSGEMPLQLAVGQA